MSELTGAQQLSQRATELELEGELPQAAETHLQAGRSAPADGQVQAALASHFVREHLPAVRSDPQLAQQVAAAFEAAGAAGCCPLAEYAEFLYKVAGELPKAGQCFEAALAEAEDPTMRADLQYNFANFLDHAMGQPEPAAAAYEAALAACPQHILALNNYAALLIEQARTDPAGTGAGLLGKASQLLEQAEALAPGFPAYNLACLSALAENQPETERWLRAAYSGDGFDGLPAAGDLAEDDDLQGVAGTAWFGALVKEISEAEQKGERLARSEGEAPCEMEI